MQHPEEFPLTASQNAYLSSDPLRRIGFAPLPDLKVEAWKAAIKRSNI